VVRLLIRMRAAMLAHQAATRFGIVAAVMLLLFGLLSAGSTFLLGFATYTDAAAGSDAIAAVMFVWIVGRVGYAAFSGDGTTLRYEMFRMLPVPRAKLARSLLVLGLFDPAQVFLLRRSVRWSFSVPGTARERPSSVRSVCC
jgi:ABC-2 type transport system permease protein